MAKENQKPKLSLAAQFDDICRHHSRNADKAEEEMLLEFVRNQEDCRKRWDAAVTENKELKNEIASLTAANKELERKSANVKEALQNERLRIEKSEDVVKELERQLHMIRVFVASKRNLPTKTAEKLSVLVPVDSANLQDRGHRLCISDDYEGTVLSPRIDCLENSDNGGHGANSPLSQGKRQNSSKSTAPVAKEKAHVETRASAASALHITVVIKKDKEPTATSGLVNEPVAPSALTPLPAAALPQPPCCPTAEAPPPCVPTSKFVSEPNNDGDAEKAQRDQ